MVDNFSQLLHLLFGVAEEASSEKLEIAWTPIAPNIASANKERENINLWCLGLEQGSSIVSELEYH